ncbi:MAG: OsmC family peroxiredoxin [Terrimesophilobacter sp.]
MSIAVRHAETTWDGPLATGSGTIVGTSGALDGQPVSWAARTEAPGGKTSPEELAAAAHSSCFSMALALKLGEHKLVPTRLVVDATVTFDAVDGLPTVVSSAVTVHGTVPGVDAEGFKSIVDEAFGFCPISRLFAGAELTVEATLEAN